MHNPCNNPVRKQIPRRKRQLGCIALIHVARSTDARLFTSYAILERQGIPLKLAELRNPKCKKILLNFPSLFLLAVYFFYTRPLAVGRPNRGKSPHIRKYSEIRRLVSAGGRAPKNYYNQRLYQIPL